VAELIAHGALFDRHEDGSLSETLEGGHSCPRIVHAGGDAIGAEVDRALRAAVGAAGVGTMAGRAIGLIESASGQVSGVLVESGGETVQIDARAVVLATGGIGNAYLTSTNPSAVRGDGLALALLAGASVVDREFVQFHPTALLTGQARGQLPLVTEAVRGRRRRTARRPWPPDDDRPASAGRTGSPPTACWKVSSSGGGWRPLDLGPAGDRRRDVVRRSTDRRP
jgi:L-aspartate oxidase